MFRAGGVAWVVGAVGFVAGLLLFLSEFFAIRYVTTITASCSDFADAKLRDNCLTVGHESHHWGFALLGLFVIVMSYGVAAGGSRPAAIALLVAGVLGLAIVLLHDLPDTAKKGEVGIAFAEGKAHKGTGFWLELVGGGLGLVAGGVMLARLQGARNSGNEGGPETEPASS
jgi:hypothetical protein